jgi:hypothetical protein
VRVSKSFRLRFQRCPSCGAHLRAVAARERTLFDSGRDRRSTDWIPEGDRWHRPPIDLG